MREAGESLAPLVPLVHGVDLVSCARLSRSVDRFGDRFLERVFTPDERAYADASAKRRIEHLAARFAAKEAVLKALGTGWRHGIAWTDVEVVREASGRPSVRLHAEAARVAGSLGVAGWALSLSHTSEAAIASVIGWVAPDAVSASNA
ncbi:MAG: holo-[acyl-carrier-protein] synthase [Phycisphaerales bacterium]|nr:MAG: holo-[acyl-carrier-protein] synthase [Phycisphaerales bacterium]